MTVRFRRDGKVVTFFETNSGAKLRLGFGKYTKASRPELVDIKINDYCPFMCSFCYQGSTPQGGHSSLFDIAGIAHELAKAKVFEVALGGGEPTMHPHFVEILREFRAHGIVPNFTTKSLGHVERFWPEIKDTAGAFAYSAETLKDLDKLAYTVNKANIPLNRINVHYVMGLGSEEDFIKFMARAHDLGFRVTLLGYKTVGRGDEVEHVDYDWWIGAVEFLRFVDKCPTFSIDTPMAEQFDGKMPVESFAYHTREGAFSMYIDAVAMKMGASSFENLETLQPFDDNWLNRYAEI